MPSFASSTSSSGSGSYDWDEITTVGSNTWTVPSGVKLVYVTLVGGGGGGGLAPGTNVSGLGAAGGGAGGVILRLPLAVTPLESLTVVVGAGGIGGTADGYTNSVFIAGIPGTHGGSTQIKRGNAIIARISGGYSDISGTGEDLIRGKSGSGAFRASNSFSGTTFAAYHEFLDGVWNTEADPTTGVLSELPGGGVVMATSSGGLAGSSSVNGTTYVKGGISKLRPWDEEQTRAFSYYGSYNYVRTGGKNGGGQGLYSAGGAGGMGWLLTPASPPAGSDGVIQGTAAGGQAPGWGGGGGGAGAATYYAKSGNGQPGYCLIEWGL